MQPRVLILRAPGTNSDREAAFAFEMAGARAELVHLNRLLENPKLAADYQILCLPGGFSYGDDISAGRIFGNEMRHHLQDDLAAFKAAGKLMLGICNGFQILIKSGVLLPDSAAEPTATLTLNDSGKYEDRWVHLQVPANNCVFLRGIDRMYLPVAHAEGKFVPRDSATLAQLESNDQLALRYAEPESEISNLTSEISNLKSEISDLTSQIPYPANPNGALANVAGVCDETGRVLGLMPHPERNIDPTHHPRWTREMPDRGDGLAMFENAVNYFR